MGRFSPADGFEEATPEGLGDLLMLLSRFVADECPAGSGIEAEFFGPSFSYPLGSNHGCLLVGGTSFIKNNNR